jgi:dTMP kinase
MKGVFIAIEGIDGCGKGTVITRLAQELFDADKNNHVYLTREPYDRDWLNTYLSKPDIPKRGEEALKLFVEDRKRHCTIMEKLLEERTIVITDRYAHSTYAYQMAQGIPFEKIKALHKGLTIPDLVIVIDIPVEEAIKRLRANRGAQDGFEQKEFLQQVKDNYLKLKDLLKENIIYVQGDRDRETVYQEVKKAALKLISK